MKRHPSQVFAFTVFALAMVAVAIITIIFLSGCSVPDNKPEVVTVKVPPNEAYEPALALGIHNAQSGNVPDPAPPRPDIPSVGDECPACDGKGYIFADGTVREECWKCQGDGKVDEDDLGNFSSANQQPEERSIIVPDKLTNQQVLAYYVTYEKEIAAVWVELGEDATMRDAVTEWLAHKHGTPPIPVPATQPEGDHSTTVSRADAISIIERLKLVEDDVVEIREFVKRQSPKPVDWPESWSVNPTDDADGTSSSQENEEPAVNIKYEYYVIHNGEEMIWHPETRQFISLSGSSISMPTGDVTNTQRIVIASTKQKLDIHKREVE